MKMKATYVKKSISIGTGMYVLIPAKIVREYHLLPGQDLEISIEVLKPIEESEQETQN